LDKKVIESALNKLYSSAKERKFDESIELIITFKNLNIKNKEHRVDYFVNMPHPYIQTVKSLVFVKDKHLAEGLKGIVDKVILDEEIQNISKKEIKKMSAEYDVFLAEGPVMLTIGKYLGQVLSPRGKMPIIAPPNPQAIKATIEQAASRIKVSNTKNKSSVALQLKVGRKSMTKLDVAENAMAIYNSIIEKLPAGKHNVKALFVKTTMSKPEKVGGAE